MQQDNNAKTQAKTFSPDLKVTEMVWWDVKRVVYKQIPDISSHLNTGHCFFLLPYDNWDSLQNPGNAVEADGWMENRAYTASHFTKFVFVVVVFLQFWQIFFLEEQPAVSTQ